MNPFQDQNAWAQAVDPVNYGTNLEDGRESGNQPTRNTGGHHGENRQWTGTLPEDHPDLYPMTEIFRSRELVGNWLNRMESPAGEIANSFSPFHGMDESETPYHREGSESGCYEDSAMDDSDGYDWSDLDSCEMDDLIPGSPEESDLPNANDVDVPDVPRAVNQDDSFTSTHFSTVHRKLVEPNFDYQKGSSLVGRKKLEKLGKGQDAASKPSTSAANLRVDFRE